MKSKSGFTLVEMLVVIAIIVLLVALVIPSLQNADTMAKRVKCISNLRQLSAGWVTYAADYSGIMVGGGTGRPYDWTAGGNTADGITTGKLYPYIRSVVVYQCPEEVPRCGGAAHARSYSANMYMRGDAEGGWCYGAATRVSHLPKPAQTYLYVDEWDTRGYNQGGFVMYSPEVAGSCRKIETWTDFVANMHNNADCFSFGDGHAELWHWRDPRTIVPALTCRTPGNLYATPGNPDFLRFEQVAYPQ